MEKRNLGKTDLEVSVLGFGGAELGFVPNVQQSDVDNLLNSALDSGLNLIDTAAGYLNSEKLIGNAVSHRRNPFYLISKCGALDGFTREDWSKQGVLDAITQSLQDMKTDYLDIAQLHSCSAEVLRQGDCIEGLQRAVERGYTRYIGYSGDNEDAKFAIELGVFDTLQTSVSIADQSPIDGNIKLAKDNGLGVIAKRPIANAVWRNSEKPADAYHHPYWERIQKLPFPFLKKSLEESISKALRFTLSIEGVTTAIVGTTKPNRWQENAKYVAEGKLSNEEFNEIREIWNEIADETWVGKT
ncbi:MAG: aldo/keto reductase [Pyrinomonadaceae bacterium]|nr:aldo/keto reductase [Pyrinomonadaceae bacterium]